MLASSMGFCMANTPKGIFRCPHGNLSAEVAFGNGMTISLIYTDTGGESSEIVNLGPLLLRLSDGVLPVNAEKYEVSVENTTQSIATPLSRKSQIKEQYLSADIHFPASRFTVMLRLYDKAFASLFVLESVSPVVIKPEGVKINLPSAP